MKSRPKHYKVKRLRVWKFAGEHNSKWRLKEFVKKSDIMTYLEGVEALVWVHLTPCSSEAVCCQLFYLW